jgi:hypothetical protein
MAYQPNAETGYDGSAETHLLYQFTLGNFIGAQHRYGGLVL